MEELVFAYGGMRKDESNAGYGNFGGYLASRMFPNIEVVGSLVMPPNPTVFVYYGIDNRNRIITESFFFSDI